MDGKTTYHQQITYCGKPRCRKCRDGIGHGPYWYAYRMIDGQTVRTYIGKNLPPDVQATLDVAPTTTGDSAMLVNTSGFEPGTPLVRISTLGQFRLECRQLQQWQTVTDTAWQQRPVRSLLAYLICSPERKVSRSQVIDALWPTADSASANNNLNKTIRSLGKVLGHSSVELAHSQTSISHVDIQPLQIKDEWLVLAGQDLVKVDADDFEHRLTLLFSNDSTDHLPHSPSIHTDTMQTREQLLRDAVSLYSGNFLIEEHEAQWVIARRQALRHHWSTLLLELADLYTARETPTDAIELLDRLLASDPTNEPAVQRLIITLASLKRRGEALRAYKLFAKVLQREYKAVPSSETRELYAAVAGGKALPAHLVATSRSIQAQPLLNRSRTDSSTPGVQLISREAPTETIGRTHQSPLVGRNAELAAMRSMLLEVEQGGRLQTVGHRSTSGIPLDTQRRPQCMVLMGESGLGKTRLAEEMSREARTRGWTVIWSRLYTQESSVPYRLWTETLRKTLNMQAGLLSVINPHLLQPLMALLPELRQYVTSDVLEQAPPAHALTPEQEQLRLWEAIGDLLKTISENTPLLIVLDDIQWADDSSHDLLGYLARHLSGYPVLFLSTCRDTELPKRPPHPLRKLIAHMKREHTIQTINVEPLSSEQIGLLVAGLSSLPDVTVKHIQDHAAGNPFFAEELARSTPPSLPKTITAALEHRMNRLSQLCQQLLGNAAVLGVSFELPVIRSMDVSRELADEDVVLDLLEEAISAGVLTEEGMGTRITYHFWHPTLVSHLYDSVSALRRARLHQRAAEVLQRENRGREDEVAATIAYHLVKAGAEPAKIAYHAELAGNRAYAVFAYPGAEDHYRLAVENMELANQSTDQGHLASLIERLAECTMVRGHFAEARSLYERVLHLRSQVPLSAIDPQYEAQMRALLLAEISLIWRYTGENKQALQTCEQGEQILREAAIVGGPAWARLYYLRSNLYKQEGQYDEALRIAQEALTLFEQQLATSKPGTSLSTHSTRIQRTLEGDPVNIGRMHRFIATIAEALGQLTNVLTHQHEALALYEKYDEKRQIAHLSCDMGYIYLKKAEYELAKAELRRAHMLAERIGDRPLLAIVYSDWGEFAAAKGELEEAERWYRQALEMTEEDREYISIWNAALAIVLQDLGKSKEAASCLKQAWSLGRSMHNTPCIGLALVTLGNIRISQASHIKTASARKRLLKHAKVNVQRALAFNKLEVETRIKGQLALAHITLLQGKTEQAHTAIHQVIADAQRCELALIAESAKQLLSSSGR